MARKKSINDLYSQLVKFKTSIYFMRAYRAYYRAFENRFGCTPHTSECKKFVETYGIDYKM